MKLVDLVEQPITYRTVRRAPDQYWYDVVDDTQHHLQYKTGRPRMLRQKGVKHLGSGSYASAYTHEERPHEVRKVSAPAHEVDGFYYYAEAILNSDDRDNPYFPRIYDMKVYTAKEGKTMYSVKMERLTTLFKLDSYQLEAMIRPIFGEKTDAIIAHRKVKKLAPFDVSMIVSQSLKNFANMRKKIADPAFARAIDLVESVIRNNRDVVHDLISSSNIMARLSPHGIHLVLSDPVV